MSECLVIPPSIINNTVVALSKDRMCTVFWNEQTKSFESADGMYTVAEVADAPPASSEKLKSLGVTYTLVDKEDNWVLLELVHVLQFLGFYTEYWGICGE